MQNFIIFFKIKDKDEVNLKSQPIEFYFLGSGFPLFFCYLKYCIFLLVIMIISSGFYNLVSNLINHDCITPKEALTKNIENFCNYNILNLFSLANKRNQNGYLRMQQFLNFVTVVIIIITLQFYRFAQRKINVICDKAELSASDYSIYIKGFPFDLKDGIDYDEEIKHFIEEEVFKDECKLEISKINLAYDLTSYQDLIKKKENLIKEKQKAFKFKHANNRFPDYFSEDRMNDQCNTLYKEIEVSLFNKYNNH